ncbi:MAG: CRISPR-associated protein Csm7 [Candidatus Competibacteraceae bacterium]|nr:MAG: CRISPR-associated protein Csm7 [Candidatus Competibacteraceae bacterium]
MDTITLRIHPLSPFGTPPLGDTLFGQLCWALRHQAGEARLRELLDGYLENRPFAVVADALPAGYLPRPALPLSWFEQPADADRKRLKQRNWIPHSALRQPVRSWLNAARSDREVTGHPDFSLRESWPQPHNSINRLTGTTGEGGFAPYTMLQIGFAPGLTLDLLVVFDPARLSAMELLEGFESIGATGFGRDASIGLGKFSVEESAAACPPAQAAANAYLTLAPCAPQGCDFLPHASRYQPFTRFGRHGDQAVHSGQPFKTPVLLAAAGAVLKPGRYVETGYVGRGLGGDGRLSRAIPATVHQGYAPAIGVHLPDEEEQA